MSIAGDDDFDYDDDALFMGALHSGRIWIEDDDDEETLDVEVIDEAYNFIQQQPEERIKFDELCRHLYKIFPDLKASQLGSNGQYKELLAFFADQPDEFEVWADADKRGVNWIRTIEEF